MLFKVGVSCYAAVLSDAKLKGFSSSSARTGQPGQRFAAGFFSSQMVVLRGAHGILQRFNGILMDLIRLYEDLSWDLMGFV